MLVDGVAELHNPLIDPARIGDDHQQQPGRGQRDHLEVTHGWRWKVSGTA